MAPKVSQKSIDSNRQFLTALLKAKNSRERSCIIKSARAPQLRILANLFREVCYGQIPLVSEKADKKKLSQQRESIESFLSDYGVVSKMKRSDLEDGFNEAILNSLPIIVKAVCADNFKAPEVDKKSESVSVNKAPLENADPPPPKDTTVVHEPKNKEELESQPAPAAPVSKKNVPNEKPQPAPKFCPHGPKCSHCKEAKIKISPSKQSNPSKAPISKADYLSAFCESVDLDPNEVDLNYESENENTVSPNGDAVEDLSMEFANLSLED